MYHLTQKAIKMLDEHCSYNQKLQIQKNFVKASLIQIMS